MEYISQSLYKRVLDTLTFIYNQSKYGSLDTFRIKDVLDSFSEGQIQSKRWAVENLIQLVAPHHDRCMVIGGWYGLFSYLLAEEGFEPKITNIDLDPSCELIGYKINDNPNIGFETANGFEFIDNDAHNNKSKIVVCTACEHIDQEEIDKFLQNKDRNMLVCFQSNNYYEVDSHINCKDSLDDFVNSLSLQIVLYSGQMRWKDEYDRFMVIGR